MMLYFLFHVALAGPIEDAIALRRGGDIPGARNLLLAMEPLVTDGERGWYLYQRGVCEELDNHPDRAEGLYREAIDVGGDTVLDAHFRLALVLEDQHRDAEALREIVGLDHVKGLEERDEITIALQRGITEVHTHHPRRGIRRISKALEIADVGNTHAYMRSKARATLVEVILSEADRLTLDGPERRMVRRLKRRAQAIKDAEAQIIELAGLQEPEWILASLVALGDAYLSLGDAVASAPPPARLDAASAGIYRSEVAKKAENAKTKAYHAWDSGVALATRLGYESPRVAVLKERRAQLEGAR